MCGYACINCGRCKGEVRMKSQPGLCLFCGEKNNIADKVCQACGKKLPPKAGSVRK